VAVTVEISERPAEMHAMVDAQTTPYSGLKSAQAAKTRKTLQLL
jgi:hypothetical protein